MKSALYKSVVTLRFIINRIRQWILSGLYNSVIARDPRFFFSCIAHQRLPRSTRIPHATGIVVGSGVDLGENVAIYQNVTIGGRGWEYETRFPEIGDNALIYSGAVVLGDINIGENAVVAANAVVLDDVPEGAVVAGVPAEIVSVDRSAVDG